MRAGAALAPFLQAGDCVLLHGDLGTGKTTFVRGLIQGCAAQNDLPPCDVPSPTFTLVQLYTFGDTSFHHYDLYRLPEQDNERDLVEIGLTDSLDKSVVLIEWPDRLGDLTPQDALHITLDTTPDNQRTVVLCGTGQWQQRLHTVRIA